MRAHRFIFPEIDLADESSTDAESILSDQVQALSLSDPTTTDAMGPKPAEAPAHAEGAGGGEAAPAERPAAIGAHGSGLQAVRGLKPAGSKFSLSAYPATPSFFGAQGVESVGVKKKRGKKKLNHVLCDRCNKVARPNVLMFDDEEWVEVSERPYNNWIRAAKQGMKDRKKLVILEGGCGKRVPTVRMNSNSLTAAGAELIRINLDFPDNPKTPQRTTSFRTSVLWLLPGHVPLTGSSNSSRKKASGITRYDAGQVLETLSGIDQILLRMLPAPSQ
eukprot:CAMPEP_0184304246 /NCGR_PEP_ID=MMETSP1049-20130417/13821_1 /TAXON_ID=77928 /ORGANISM="Proteomonas sulcata, Strain CCMP704" /LENGTH=275 /DNA_ID=CAMNT_0026616011 /DNA_START=261 /DNA_END=1088 /DNA_ORIENTATION=+